VLEGVDGLDGVDGGQSGQLRCGGRSRRLEGRLEGFIGVGDWSKRRAAGDRTLDEAMTHHGAATLVIRTSYGWDWPFRGRSPAAVITVWC
jgi:hypothetical protein